MPPACERCSRPLPYPDDPFKPKPPPARTGRYREGEAGPLRVTKAGGDEVTWWCGRACFEEAHAKPLSPKEKRRQKSGIRLRGSPKAA